MSNSFQHSSIPACSDVSDPIETEIVILERDVCMENVAEKGSKVYSLWLICTTHFGMRTGNEIHKLCWGDVTLCVDFETGEEYISLDTERQTKTRTGENTINTR